MILSDRPNGRRPGAGAGAAPGASVSAASPVAGKAAARPAAPLIERPVPKALCDACKRPVANLRSATCVYCGAAIPGSVRAGLAPAPRAGIPAEMLVMLEPRAAGSGTGRRKWLVRLAAAGLATVVLLIIVRVMNPPN